MSIYQIVVIDGVDYNSWESLADADIYLAAEVNATAWRALGGDTDAKGMNLVSATRILERQPWRDGVIVDPLPQQLKDATALLAAAIAGGYDAADQASTSTGIKRLKAGSVEQEFFFGASGGVDGNGYRFPLSIWELIKGFLAGSGGTAGIGGSSSSGTCGRSITDIDYGYNQGAGYDGPRRDCC